LGKTATHKVINAHWIFTVVKFEEEGEAKESDAVPVLVVNLEQIREAKPNNINQLKNVFH
jgi:hypothetical protein